MGSIQRIDQWLDREVGERYKDEPLAQDWARISKIAEELGEAIQEFIGVTGQNPRKGVYSKIEDTLDELADTVWTGIFAIQHFTKDENKTSEILAARLKRIEARVPNV